MNNFGKKFLSFVDSSPTPFHVCQTVSKLLQSAGFQKLSESTPWNTNLEPGGKYFFTRNGSSIVAFCVGNKYKSGNGFKIIGAHTDSPVLKVKPVSKQNVQGVVQVGVECYGGGLWHTWLDRDLGIAGRVIVYTGKDTFKQRLVHINDPILRVPTLCIHLQSANERTALTLNTEDNLTPILSLISSTLNAPSEGKQALKGDSSSLKQSEDEARDFDTRHPACLLKLIAAKLDCNPADIVEFELSLCDTQPATFGGAFKEFIFSPRLDNQIHCFTSINALIDFSSSDLLMNDDGVSLAILFDHEEVGSDSNEGAGSPILRDTIERITTCFHNYETSSGDEVVAGSTVLQETLKICLSRTIVLSADSAHAIHPNYAGKHEKNHQPKMGEGTVIKTNSNQRYATNAITGFFVREICRRNTVLYDGESGNTAVPIPYQEFVVRNDVPCGSTIGPITAHNVGVRVVDIGVPQLSMHSIREQCAIKDLWSNYHLLKAFFKDAGEIDKQLSMN